MPIALPATIAGVAGTVTIAGVSASVVASVALTAGSLLLARAMTPGMPKAAGALPPQALGNFRQSAPAQRVVYGTQRVGGPLFFLDDTNPPFLYWGVLLSARPISRFGDVYIDNVAVGAVKDSAGATSYSSEFEISFRNGDSDQAIDPLLATDFPSLPATFRQRGHATAVIRARFGQNPEHHAEVWGTATAIPNLSFEVDGAPIYNPLDAGQLRDDPATWKFSRLASLIIADYLRADYGGRVPADRIDWDKVARSAEYDQSLVGTEDEGLQLRWLLDGTVSKDQSPIDVIEGMLLGSRAFIGWTQGNAWVMSSEKRAPVATIHDKMLVGGFEYSPTRPRKAVLNKVRGRFPSGSRGYQADDAPIILDAIALAEEDGEPLEATLDLSFVTRHQQVQRLMKAALEESRLGPSIAVVCTLDAVALEAGDVVNVWSRLFPTINGVYVIEEQGFAEDFSTISLNLAAYDGDIDGNWHHETDEQEYAVADIDVST